MSIDRKWAFARATVYDDDLTVWVAESRAGSGSWVIREADPEEDGHGIIGEFFDFPEDGVRILSMTDEQRAKIGMSLEVYYELEVQLRESQRRDRRIDEARKGLWARVEPTRELLFDCALSETTPMMVSHLRVAVGVPDIIEGLSVDVGGLRLSRVNGSWQVAIESEATVDAAAREQLGLGAKLPDQ